MEPLKALLQINRTLNTTKILKKIFYVSNSGSDILIEKVNTQKILIISVLLYIEFIKLIETSNFILRYVLVINHTVIELFLFFWSNNRIK